MEIDLKPETIAFLLVEFDDVLQNCNLEEPVFEDIANLLNLLANMDKGSTIHVNL
jgi:hypothetical protein